jgi:hypothetical protein
VKSLVEAAGEVAHGGSWCSGGIQLRPFRVSELSEDDLRLFNVKLTDASSLRYICFVVLDAVQNYRRQMEEHEDLFCRDEGSNKYMKVGVSEGIGEVS